MSGGVDQQYDATVGGEAFAIALADPDVPVEVGQPVLLTVDYQNAEIEEGSGEGVVLPLIFRVIEPDGSQLLERAFSTTAPATLEFEPKQRGRHLVRLGEQFHQRWFGFLVVTVVGDLDVEG